MIIAIQNTIGALQRRASTAASIITQNLQLWLGFTSSSWVGGELVVLDKSTNTNNAKLFTGKALEFNGNDTVQFTTPTDIVQTIAIWFLPTVSNTTILGSTLGSEPEISPRDSSNSVYVRGVGVFNFTTIESGVWHRLVITKDDSDVFKMYINGIASNTTYTASTKDLQINQIGARQVASYFNGSAADLQIYNTAWDSDDVAFDYANPNNLVIDNPNATITKSNLVGYWALSEGSGNIAFDSAGLGGEDVVDGNLPLPNTAWAFHSNWTINNNTASCSNATPNTGDFLQSNVFSIGKTYLLTFDVEVILGTLSVILDGHNLITTASAQSQSITKTATTTSLTFRNYNNFVGSISNISVREVTDNDGTLYDGGVIGATWVDQQPTIPQLGMMDWSKGSNLIEFSEDFANAAWSKSGMTITSGFSSPNGSLSSDKLVGTTGAAIYNSGITSIASTSYTLSFYVKNIDYVNNAIAIRDDSNGEFIDVDISYTATSEWTRITHSFTTPVGCVSLRVYPQRKADGVGSMYVWGAQLEQSSTVGSYIGTAGSAASNATLIQNPNDLGKDVLGNSLRLREGGFNLDGSGYAEVADNSTIQVGNTLSLGFWVKPTSNSNDSMNLLYKDSWVNGYGVYRVSNTKIRLYLDGTHNTSDMTLTIGSWNYVSITYDGSNINFYLNGVVNGSPIAKTATVNSSGHNLFIGSNESLNERYDGIINEILIYDTPLTATEILNNYNVGLATHS